VEEIMAAFGIPVLVINYWNFLITAQRKAGHFAQVLEKRGYPGPHFFALGYASSLEPEEAPWGGLPKPTLIIGATRHETEMKITELWARELGCPCFPLDFNFASPYRRIPPADWWANFRDNWPRLVDPARLDLRVEQNKALIAYMEVVTGRAFGWQELRRVMERVNAQMDVMSEARDVMAAARPCPVTLRDQVSAYQTNWHRGTSAGLDVASAYRDEVRHRVDAGIGAYRQERTRMLYWSMQQEPDFHAYLQERYGAVFVGAPYGAMPATYARTVYNDDPLRALAARQTFLFDMTSPSWMLSEAQRYGADVVVGVEEASHYASRFRQACESAGLRYLAVPRVSDDAEIRELLDGFFNQ
jgi:benzoyl-CoA reductase subunit B